MKKSKNVSNAFKELRDITSGGWDKFKNNEDISQFIGRENEIETKQVEPEQDWIKKQGEY